MGDVEEPFRTRTAPCRTRTSVVTFTRDQRNRTFAALQTLADEEQAQINRAALERVFEAAEAGEPNSVRQLERINGVLALAMLRHADVKGERQ